MRLHFEHYVDLIIIDTIFICSYMNYIYMLYLLY
jgi:hypothetical protein